MNELAWAELRGRELHQQADHYRLVRIARQKQRVRLLPLITILLGLIRR